MTVVEFWISLYDLESGCGRGQWDKTPFARLLPADLLATAAIRETRYLVGGQLANF